METARVRILVVDDYEPWRRWVCSMLQIRPELQVIGEVSDGLEAVQTVQELQPDLILLDIGLPKLNGIEAVRQIRELAPKSKILFVSENRSRDIAEEALRTGAGGYVIKSSAGSELLPAVRAVLQGKRFVSARLAGHDLSDPTEHAADSPRHKEVVTPLPLKNVEMAHHHKAGFYHDDRRLLDGLTQFIGSGLRAGSAAIVVATQSHQDSLLPRLQAFGLDISAAIEEGRYIAVDAADTISTFIVNNMLDTVRFMESIGNLILTASKAAKTQHPRVVVFGEGAHLLSTQGNVQAAIQDEKLCNQLIKMYDVDILCGYSLGSFRGEMGRSAFEKICAEHSAVYSL